MTQTQKLAKVKTPKPPSKAQLSKAEKLFGPIEEKIVEPIIKINSVMDFAVQQLSATISPSEAQATPIIKNTIIKTTFDKIIKNGITRPKDQTICGHIWKTCDQLSIKNTATILNLKQELATEFINDHTLKTQFARWKSFNGIKGRSEKIIVQQVVGEYEGMTTV